MSPLTRTWNDYSAKILLAIHAGDPSYLMDSKGSSFSFRAKPPSLLTVYDVGISNGRTLLRRNLLME